VLSDAKAQFLGYVSAVEIGPKENPLDQVPEEFRQFLPIMSKEAADSLPEHTAYDMKIDLKYGTTAPWGPIYLSRIWRDRLLGAAAGAILTIAGLWFVLVARATATYVFRG
jgi:hypothetical protein